MKLICAILLLIFVENALFQVISYGRCPEVHGKPDFNMNLYTKRWFGYSKYSFFTNIEDRCHYANYVIKDYPYFISYNNGINKKTGKWVRQIWDSKLRRPGEMGIAYNDKQNMNRTNFIVMDTDYYNWTSAYYCKNLKGNRKEENVFCMTRVRNPPAEVVKAAYAVYEKHGIDTSKLMVNDQTNCPDDSAAFAKQI